MIPRPPQRHLIHARLTQPRQQHKVLLARDLHVDVLVVVPVQRRHGAGGADPQVGGVGVAGQGDACPGDGGGDVG